MRTSDCLTPNCDGMFDFSESIDFLIVFIQFVFLDVMILWIFALCDNPHMHIPIHVFPPVSILFSAFFPGVLVSVVYLCSKTVI